MRTKKSQMSQITWRIDTSTKYSYNIRRNIFLRFAVCSQSLTIKQQPCQEPIVTLALQSLKRTSVWVVEAAVHDGSEAADANAPAVNSLFRRGSIVQLDMKQRWCGGKPTRRCPYTLQGSRSTRSKSRVTFALHFLDRSHRNYTLLSHITQHFTIFASQHAFPPQSGHCWDSG
jgi:hypothetical protein